MMAKKIIADAQFTTRTIAFLIDLLIIGIVLQPVSSVLSNMVSDVSFSSTYDLLSTNEQLLNTITGIFLFSGIVAIIYFSFLEYKTGQTAGKKLMKIRVVSDQDGISFFQSLLRNLYLLPFFPFIILWFVEPIYLLLKGVRLSEKVTKTRTVQEY